MKTKTQTKYICEICGTEYDTEIKAKQCEKLGNLFKKHEKQNYPRYCWYIIENCKTKQKHILYVSYIDFCLGLRPTCISKSIKLISYEDDCPTEFIILSNTKEYKIVKILNVEQCYEKYGIIPKNHIRTGNAYSPDSFFDYTERKIEDITRQEIESKLEKLRNLSSEEILKSNNLKNYLLEDSYSRDFSKVALRNFK